MGVPGWEKSSAISARRVAAAWGWIASGPLGQSGCGNWAGWLNASAVTIARRPRELSRTI